MDHFRNILILFVIVLCIGCDENNNQEQDVIRPKADEQVNSNYNEYLNQNLRLSDETLTFSRGGVNKVYTTPNGNKYIEMGKDNYMQIYTTDQTWGWKK